MSVQFTTRLLHQGLRKRRLGLWLFLASALLFAGCDSSGPAASTATSGVKATTKKASKVKDFPKAKNAGEVLETMAEAYQRADGYADEAKINLRFLRGGEETKVDFDFAVALVRPNKMRLKIYQAMITSDGEKFRATVEDQRFAGDVLEIDAPPAITLDYVYADRVLAPFLTQGLAGGSIQILLLLGEKPLDVIMQNTDAPKLLKGDKIGNHACYRVQAHRDDGELSLWVDERSRVLRRLEFPTAGLKDELERDPAANGGAISELSLRADFKNARFSDSIDDSTFEFEVPDDAKLVRYLNPRKFTPPPSALSKYLGQKAKDFSFTGLDGEAINLEKLSGKIAVIDFWATWCQPCIERMPEVEAVYQKYKDNEKVQFLAVSIDDPKECSDEKLTEAIAAMKLNVPAARTTVEAGMGPFGLEVIPNLVVLGPDGMIQDNLVGVSENMASELEAKIEKLLAGTDLHEAALADYQNRVKQHEEWLNAPLPEDEGEASSEVPHAQIAPRTEPKSLKLEKLWTSTELKQPGNILVVPQSDGTPLLLVNEGWNRVIQLDTEGKVVAQHQLKIPDDSVVTTLRAGSDAEGKTLYAGLASAQQQMHLFDSEWNLLFSYPDSEGKHAGIADALLTDLDGDKSQELYVSYWDVVGVQGVSLAGKRIWGNRELENVFRMTALDADADGRRRLLCTSGGQRPALVVLNSEGRKEREIVTEGRFLRLVEAADLDANGEAEYCGVAATTEGKETIIGFSLDGKELWSHPLAPGVHETPIEMVTTGRVLESSDRSWLAAGPDGTILIIALDGTLVESFQYGSALMGLAAAEFDGRRLLLVSTVAGVDAWQITE